MKPLRIRMVSPSGKAGSPQSVELPAAEHYLPLSRTAEKPIMRLLFSAMIISRFIFPVTPEGGGKGSLMLGG